MTSSSSSIKQQEEDEEEEEWGKEKQNLEAYVASCEAEIQGIDDRIQSLIRKVGVDADDAYTKIRRLQAVRRLMNDDLCSLKEEGMGKEVLKE